MELRELYVVDENGVATIVENGRVEGLPQPRVIGLIITGEPAQESRIIEEHVVLKCEFEVAGILKTRRTVKSAGL